MFWYDECMSSLIFVYNAESGLVNALLDTGRRIFRPSQYECALCMVTYGPFGMKDDWKKFISELPYEVSFLHKNELTERFRKMHLDYPCLILDEPKGTKIILDGTEFRKVKDLYTLQKKVTKGLKAHAQLTK